MNHLTDKKQAAILIFASIILLLSIRNIVTDQHKMEEHHDFFKYMQEKTNEMHKYISKDDNNTLVLCKNINEIKVALDKKPLNCDELYLKQ